jgi:hypothetical protein
MPAPDSQKPPIESQSGYETESGATGGRHFGYIPDPSFTREFGQSLVHDDELDRLLSAERQNIFADTARPKLFGWLAALFSRLREWSIGSVRLGPQFAASYVEAGGNLANLRRIVQVVVDQGVQEELSQLDVPGPDAWIKPKIREAIVFAIGKKFDKFIGG